MSKTINSIHAGTTNIRVTYRNNGLSFNNNDHNITVNKAPGSVTDIPADRSATCCSATSVATSGSGTGTMMYRLGTSGSYSSTMPTSSGLNPGSYILYYYAAANGDYAQSAIGSITVTVVKCAGSVSTAPTDSNPKYGSGNYLCSTGSSNTGTMYYKLSGGTYSTTRPTTSGLNVGSYTLYYYSKGSSCYNDSSEGSIKVTVVKADQSAPTATGTTKTYPTSGSGSASGGGGQGTLYYKIDTNGGTSYGSAITTAPSRSTCGTTTFIAYWGGNGNYNASGNSSQASIVINKGTPTYTAPTAKTGLTYNGNSQTLYNAGSNTTAGSFSYNNGTRTNAGTQTVSWTFTPTDGCYNSASGSFQVTIGQATGSATVTGLTKEFNGTTDSNGIAQNIVSVSGATGTMHYRVGTSGSWTTTIPTRTNAGSDTIYYYMDASTNYTGRGSESSPWGNVTGTVQKRGQGAPTISGATSTYPTSATASVSTVGKIPGTSTNNPGTLTWSNQKRTTCGSQTAKAYYTETTNFSASAWSNEVTVKVNSGTPTYTAPTAKTGLVYNGSLQTLYNAGSNTTAGSFSYSNGTSTNAGTQTVSWTFTPTDGCYNGASGSFQVTIGQATGSATVTGLTKTYNGTNDTNGSAQTIVSVSGNTGTMHYRVGTGGSWTTTVPSRTNAGSDTIYYYMDSSTNYTGRGSESSPWGSVTGTVQKRGQGAPTISGATSTYPTSASASLATAGIISGGTSGQTCPGTLTWTNQTRSSCGSQTATAYYAATTNFSASSASAGVTVKVNNGTPTLTLANTNSTYPTAGVIKVTASVAGTVYWGTSSSSMTNTKSVSANTATEIYSRSTAGSTTIYAYLDPTDGCYNNSSTVNKAVSVSCKNPTLTFTALTSTLTYNNGSAQNIGTVSTDGDGTLYYVVSTSNSVPSSGWTSVSSGTTIKSSAATATTYYVFLKADAGTNYCAKTCTANSGSKAIGKATPTLTLANTNSTYPTAGVIKATASVAGKVYSGTSSSSMTTETNVNANTATTIYTKSSCGSQTIYAYFVPTDTTNYNSLGSSSSAHTNKEVTVNKGTPTTNFVCQETTYHTTAHVYFYSNVAGTIYETYNGTQLTSSNYSTAKQITKSVTAGNGSSTNACDVDSGSTANTWTIYAYFVPTDGCYNHVQLGPGTLKVNKAADASVTVTPASNAGTYGSAATLVTAANSSSHGTSAAYVGYKLGAASADNQITWVSVGTALSLSATASAGTYYIYKKWTADSNHSNGATYTQVGTLSRSKATPTMTLAKTDAVFHNTANIKATASVAGTVYWGTTSATSGMTNTQAVSASTATQLTTKTAVGSTTVYAYFVPTDTTNYNSLGSASDDHASVTMTISQATDASVSVTLASNAGTYGSAATLVTAANSSSHGTSSASIGYKLGEATADNQITWVSVGTALSLVANASAGTYYIYKKWTADSSHSNSSAYTLVGSLSRSQATGTVSFTLTNRSLYCTSTANAKSATDAQKTTDVFLSNASTNTGQTISYSMSVKNSGGSSVSNWTFDSSTGKVTIPSGQTAGTYTVSITASVPNSTNYTAASSTKSATVTINQVVLSSLNMVLRSNSIAYNETKNLATSSNTSSEVVDKVTATYSNGASKDVRVDTTYSGDSTYVTITN